MKRMRRNKPVKRPSHEYARMWRVIDGAVRDALQCHPEYLTDAGRRSAALSITKRVTGAVVSCAGHPVRGRLGG